MTYRRQLLCWLAGLLISLPILATAQGYRISPGDILRIEVVEDEALNRTVLVAPDGRISVPFAGSVRAAGRTVEAVQQILVVRLTDNFAAPPTVFVGLEQLAQVDDVEVEPEVISVFMLGEVGQPGLVEMEPGATVLQAFAQMGGFSAFAATKRVQLRRTDPKTGVQTVYALDYDAITRGATTNATLELQDGDVILVPTRRLFE
ncbi:MAG: polysaccharide biosynthesis/export family protein [Pseudomonadota bacterium]